MSSYKNGYLKLIIGPMFAGKSTELLRLVSKYKAIDKKIVTINHVLNCRYGTPQISTHDKKTIETNVICENLSEIDNDILKNTDIIIVEELQFFKDAFITIQYWVDELGKTVIAAGLDGDYERKPFGDVLRLIPHADEVTKLKALCAFCKDGTPGIFSLGKLLPDLCGQISVGAKTKYDAVCRTHYNDFQKKEGTTSRRPLITIPEQFQFDLPCNEIGGW